MIASDVGRFRLRFKLGRSDIVNIRMYLYARNPVTWAFPAILTISLFVSVTMNDFEYTQYGRLIILCASVFLVLNILSFLMYYVASLDASKRLNFEDTDCVIEDSSVRIFSPSSRAEMNWEAFKNVKLTSGYILIFFNRRDTVTLPQRAFQSPDEMQDVLNFLQKHIKDD